MPANRFDANIKNHLGILSF